VERSDVMTGGGGYLEHLSRSDLSLVGRSGPLQDGSADAVDSLRSEPSLLEGMLGEPGVYRALFASPQGVEGWLVASPFLVFAVAVNRSRRELGRAGSVTERVGARARVPMLDVARLREFLDDPDHRLFLAELLASYTRVASGAVWTRTGQGYRRQRFSDLDLVRLLRLADSAPQEQRPGLYRRAGDLALFLTGVFPDHLSAGGLGPLGAQRLAGVAGGVARADGDVVELVEDVGRRCYRVAYESVGRPVTAALGVVAGVAARFSDARRTLNYVTERHIFGHIGRWLAPGP
jgi:hypothetical protein